MELIEFDGAGTNRRFVVRLDDGATVEAVLYHGSSVCVSCQVGCAVGCPFCASGAKGLARALTLAEMSAQVTLLEDAGHEITNVTVSGVGEPLHNHQLVDFLDWCRARRIAPSVTTSGGPLPRLRELLRAHHNGVTVSVHAGNEPTRARAVPKGPALEPLFALLAEEIPALSRSRRRKIALAYLMIDGLNDGDEELDAFAERALRLEARIHLYAFNPVPTSGHRAVSRSTYAAAYERLKGRGLNVRMSSKARVETNGGCGTLVALPARRAVR